MAMTAIAVAAKPTPNAIATTRPEVVRVLSRRMQEFAPAAAEKQIRPGAQDAISVVVGMQDCVLPAETKHMDVDFVLVTEQIRGPVVVADCAVAVDVELVLSLEVLVVEEAVVWEEVVDVVDSVLDSVLDSDVVVASVDEGAVVVVFADAVLLAVFFVVVFSSVVLSSVVVSSLFCLLFNSSCPARQSKVNQTASAVASAIEHPPEIKQSSISSRRARSMSLCKH